MATRGFTGRRPAPDVSERLPDYDLPALVIVGSEDAISSPEEMRAIAEALPISMFVEIPRAGHLSPLEASDAANGAIAEFVQRMTSTPPEMEPDEDQDDEE